MAFDEENVYATGGWPEKEILALPGDRSGEIDPSESLWRSNKGVAYVPSPLLADGLLYLISDQGIAICYDVETGEALWQKRLGGAFTASPVIAGDRLYATDEQGKTFVLRAGRQFEQLAVNDLGSGGFASPAICGGSIFLRTGSDLFRIEAAN
jgi:outer membrane protein assembly factor BamB